MTQLVAISFPDRARIDEAVRTLRKFHLEHGNRLYASAVVAKATDGKLSVQEITREGHGGAIVAALIGALAGLPAGPAAATIMATGGAVIGDAADLTAQAHFTEFANGIADKVPLGGAAVVADVAEDGVPAFQAGMVSVGGTAMRLPTTHFTRATG